MSWLESQNLWVSAFLFPPFRVFLCLCVGLCLRCFSRKEDLGGVGLLYLGRTRWFLLYFSFSLYVCAYVWKVTLLGVEGKIFYFLVFYIMVKIALWKLLKIIDQNFALKIQLHLFISFLANLVCFMFFNCLSTSALLDYSVPKERILFHSSSPSTMLYILRTARGEKSL